MMSEPTDCAREVDGDGNGDGGACLDVDGARVPFRPGETVAVALLRAGIVALRSSPAAGMPRGAFCFMGVCQECVAMVDGELRQTCLTPAAPAMTVTLADRP